MTPLGYSGGSQLTSTESLESDATLILAGADGTEIFDEIKKIKTVKHIAVIKVDQS